MSKKNSGIMAMIGRNAAVAEVGEHHHELTGPIAFAAWLGLHAALLTTTRKDWQCDGLGVGIFGSVRTEQILDRPSSQAFNWAGDDESESKGEA